jgi:(R,R)-butanediol dehydrogenase/meso-butanediol dehydrogenase/diacetyl reductase
MKAAMWYEKGDIRVLDVKEPEPGPGQVKIKVKWCGICGSDVHEYTDGPISIPRDAPHPVTREKSPLILGHEFSGDVVAVGEGVTKFKIGDRVVVEPIVRCGKCKACLEGRYHNCINLGFHGISGGGGGFAEYTTFTEDFIHKLPDGITYEQGATIEPFSVGMHAVLKADFRVGGKALVLGAGPIGIGLIACLKAAGAQQIVCMQRKSVKQQYAREAGADIVLDPNECDIAEEIKKMTGGNGIEYIFDTTAAPVGFEMALDSVMKAGTITIVSFWDQNVNFNLNRVMLTEVKIIGSICFNDNFPTVMKMMEDKRINVGSYVTKKIYLDDIIEEGFDTLLGPDKKKNLKILVTPDLTLL